MRIAHWMLVGYYVLLPLVMGAWVGLRAWRGRSLRLARGFLLTALSATVIATGLVVAYAVAAGAKPLAGQILLGAYFGTAMLLTLRGLDRLLREGAGRLLGLRPAQSMPAQNEANEAPTDHRVPKPPRLLTERLIAAALLRTTFLFALGLPYVIAVVMIFRVKMIGPDPQAQLGLAFETVTFPATDGSTVEGWWIPARARPGAKGEKAPRAFGQRTVVFCHGLGASKANQIGLVGELVPAGYNVLAIDLRAHGGSGGQLTTFGDLERHDVLGAVRWLRAAHPEQAHRIDGLGVSMGAAALIAAAGDDGPEGRAIDAVAIYCTYDDLGALADEVTRRPPFDLGPLGWLVRHVSVPIANAHVGRDLRRFAPAEYVPAIAPRPVLVIHGKADSMIDWSHGLNLYRAAWQPKYAWWVDGADHNQVIEDAKAQKAVREFFDGAESIL